jgi:putative aldouronate transport system permease protein
MNKLSFRKADLPRNLFVIGNTLFLFVLALTMIIPILKVLSDSLEGWGSYGMNLIPRKPTLDAYKVIVTNAGLYRPFFISIFVTVVGTSLSLFLTTLGAYVLTRKDMPGRTFFVYLILVTMVFNGGLVPRFLVVRGLHLTNTIWSVILVSCIDTYFLILMKSFFAGIPQSLQEAADIDGCSPFGIFFKIMLPLAKPALAAIGLFYMVQYWNEFFNYVMYINNPRLYNFQVKLREMILTDDYNSAGQDLRVYGKSLQNAAIIVGLIPVLIVYPFLQKYFVSGITLGAIKG